MDGIIIINKEQGYTSNDVVQVIKKELKQKVGHTGTLDPMATGVLPILVGKGTQLSKYLINHDKIYVATLKLGIKTDTGDITGNVIKEQSVDKKCLEEENVKKVLNKVKGKQQQVPPMYSAIKVNGKKLYEYARKGQKIEVKPRTINVYDIELISIFLNEQEIKLRVVCSKGTYIRTLCEKIAEELGTIGTMSALIREKVGDFDINQAITINELNAKSKIISIEKFFEKENVIILSPYLITKFMNGVKLDTENRDGIYRIYDNDRNFIGIRNSKKWNFEKRYCNIGQFLIK